MSDEPQFNLDFDPILLEQEPAAGAPLTVEASPTTEAPPDRTATVVVVQYRNRGIPPILLFPATMILSLGMFAAYHVLFVSPRQRELQDQARAAALAAPAASRPEEPKAELKAFFAAGFSTDHYELLGKRVAEVHVARLFRK